MQTNYIFIQDQEAIVKNKYRSLMEIVGWFFFELFLLGYVEDAETGLSFYLPKKLELVVYIEVHMKHSLRYFHDTL